MKKIFIFCSFLASALYCQSQNEIVIDNFESGTYSKWTLEGDAFGTAPSKGALPGENKVDGYQGSYLANSFNNGDDSRGVMTSNKFKITKNYINFLMGGGISTDTYIELLIDGKSVIKSYGIMESESLYQMTWNVEKYKGKNAQIQIVDNQRGPWGHILIDDIVMSNDEKSVFMVDYKIPFKKADKKYILIPIDDDSPESIITLDVDGTVIGVPMYIRVAQTEKIDYWVPIDIASYKGKDVTLSFAHAKKTDLHLGDIKLSDTFDFDYNEKYRPLYHHTPKWGWMNDPNGMFYSDGEYHLYFQHNLYGSKWSNMSWGHSVSKDLVNWTNLPDAVFPDKLGSIFSGSAIIDVNNTAGFGKDAIIAIYTAAGQAQTQALAYSTDGGKTFTKYEHNPVLVDPAYQDIRDPKVMWYEPEQKWVMSLATTQTITFYESKNLKDWTKLSEFGNGIGGHGGVWECPDLFTLKTPDGKEKWILFVSINPGGPNGGNACQYFVGDFDGKNFIPDMSLPYPLWLDYGRDNYATVLWNHAPNDRKILLSWMNNWDYANSVPPINFSSANTLPREMKLIDNGKHLVLTNVPVEEVKALRSEAKTLNNIEVTYSYTIDNLLPNNNGAYEIEMTIKTKSSDFNFKLQNSKGEYLEFKFDIKNKEFSVDRTHSGLVDFTNNFASVNKAPITKSDVYKIRLFMDKNSSEIFINDGMITSTNTCYPSEIYNTLSFETNKGSTLSIDQIDIYKLK